MHLDALSNNGWLYQDIVDNYIGVQTKLFSELTQNLQSKIVNKPDSEGKQAVDWLAETGGTKKLKEKISLQTIAGTPDWQWKGMNDESKSQAITGFTTNAPKDALISQIDSSAYILKIPEVFASPTGKGILEGVSFKPGYDRAEKC